MIVLEIFRYLANFFSWALIVILIFAFYNCRMGDALSTITWLTCHRAQEPVHRDWRSHVSLAVSSFLSRRCVTSSVCLRAGTPSLEQHLGAVWIDVMWILSQFSYFPCMFSLLSMKNMPLCGNCFYWCLSMQVYTQSPKKLYHCLKTYMHLCVSYAFAEKNKDKSLQFHFHMFSV